MRGLSPAARKHALHQLRPLSASRFRLSQSRAPASELSTHRRCRFGSPRRLPTLVRSVRYALADQRQSPPASGTASEFSVTTEVAFQSHPTCRGPPRTLFARAKRQSLSGQRDPRSDPPKASAPMAEVSLRGLPTSSRARWRWPWQQVAARAWSVCSFGPTKSRGIAPIFAPPFSSQAAIALSLTWVNLLTTASLDSPAHFTGVRRARAHSLHVPASPLHADAVERKG